MGFESSRVVRFDLQPLLQDHTDQTRVAKLKVLLTHLLLALEFLECETDLQEIMGWASFEVVKFDLGPLFQGQMRVAKLKSAIISMNN